MKRIIFSIIFCVLFLGVPVAFGQYHGGPYSGGGGSGGTGGTGADANGYYVVAQSTSAPTNAVNLGAGSTGLVFCTVAGGVCTFSVKAIGTDIQAYNLNLTTIAALADAAGVLYDNGSGTFSYKVIGTDIPGITGAITDGHLLKASVTGGLSSIADAGAPITWAAKGDLAIATGANAATVLTVGADNALLRARTAANSQGVEWWAPAANMTTFLGSADYAAMRTNLGLAIGTNVQAYNSNLTGINQALDTTATPSFQAITVTGATNNNYLAVTNNAGGRAPTASAYEIYPDAGVWKWNQNGTEYASTLSPTAGQVTFAGPTQARIKTFGDTADTIWEAGAANTGAGSLLITGDLGGNLPITTLATAGTTTLAIDSMIGRVYRVSTISSINLPQGTIGRSAIFRLTGAYSVTLKPGTNDHFVLGGTSYTLGSVMSSATPAIGSFVVILYGAASVWEVYGSAGSWTVN